MATSVTANGETTSVPSIIATPNHTTPGRSLPQAKVLAITGEFEQFENGKTFEFENLADLLAAAPGDDFIEQIGGIAFAPGSDALVGAPNRVVIASSLSSAAAQLLVNDTHGALALTLKSKVWGQYGNMLAATCVANGADALKLDLSVYCQGDRDTLSGLGSGPVVEIGYAGSYADKITVCALGPVLVDTVVTSEVHVVMTKGLAGDVGTSTVPDADQTVSGKVTADPSTAFGVAAALSNVSVSVSGNLFTKSGHGLLAGDPVKFSDLVGVTGIVADTVYYVIASGLTTDDFKVSSTAGGAAFDVTGVDGTVTCTYQAATLTITGADDTGADTTEVLTIPAGGTAAVTSTKSWTRISEYVLSGSGYAGTLNVSVPVARVTRQKAPTLKKLAALLGDLPNVTATVKNARAAVLGLGDIDPLASTDFKTVNVVLRADATEAARVINARSRFVTAERKQPTVAHAWTRLPSTSVASGSAASTSLTVTSTTGVVAGDVLSIGPVGETPIVLGVVASVSDGTTIVLAQALPISFSGLPVFKAAARPPKRPAAYASVRVFAGGTTGSTDDTTRAAMYDALALTQTAIVVCMSFDNSDLLAAYQHTRHMGGIGARECCAFGAVPADATLDDIDELSLQFDSRNMAIATEEIRVIDSTGARRYLDPRFQALQVAAMMAGVGIATPLNGRRPRCVGTRSNAAWSGTKNADDIINRGAIAYSQDSEGFFITRAVTTYRSSDDVNQTELSANESVNWQIRDMREEIKAAQSRDPANFNGESLIGLAQQRGRKQAEGLLITAFYANSVGVKRKGDRTVLIYDFAPVVPNNFTILAPNIRPVEFELQAA